MALDVGQTLLVRDRDGLSAAVDAQLRQDSLDVSCNRLRTDNELAGDLRLGQAPGKQLQHLFLTTRQRLSGGIADPLDWRNSSMAKGAPHASQQFAFVEGLHDVVVGTDEQAGYSVVRLRPVTREEDDRDVIAKPDPSSRQTS